MPKNRDFGQLPCLYKKAGHKHAVATRRAVQVCRQNADVQQVAISGVAGAQGTKVKDGTKMCNNVLRHSATC
jgi:hypothetical protein